MPSIFLSHTSYDKPFVEKLAKDLKRIGINVWFDKWEIKVGDSITWKIEDGIRENEFLGIVMSPEALQSEWVKTELTSAWIKQMHLKKVVVLPILLRDCEIPLFLSDRLYADFRNDYNSGLNSLANTFGISDDGFCNESNWRNYKGKNSMWKTYRELEFHELVTKIVDRSIEYNWSVWVGGTKNPYSISISTRGSIDKERSISVKLELKSNSYIATRKGFANPNKLKKTDYDLYIGGSVNECEEFVWRELENYKLDNGNPEGEQVYFVQKHVSTSKTFDFAKEITEQMGEMLTWYRGDKLNNFS